MQVPLTDPTILLFAREGYALIAGAALLSVGLTLLGMQLAFVWRVPLYLVAALLFGFTLYFFRDPARTPPPDAVRPRALLAPADGKVVAIVEEEEPDYLEGPSTRVSIFLSPLDVHVNRVPADGVVEYERYVPGDYLVAWHPKASEKNEHSEIGLRHPTGLKVFFKQIAGAVARRIVYYLEAGDTVQAGQRFGIVKFGSRMDVHVPSEVIVDARVGQRVRAGESVLGHFPLEMAADTAWSTVRKSPVP